MSELFADRFLSTGSGWIDLASGAAVRLHVEDAATGCDALVWNDWCATFASLRHPVVNPLLDYGAADVVRTFQAYRASGPVPAYGPSASVLVSHATRFLEAQGLPLRFDVAPLALRQVAANGVKQPRRPVGVLLQHRQIVTTVVDALSEVAAGGVTRIDVFGEAGSGIRTVRTVVARAARLMGYVPICARMVATMPWIGSRLRDRHVCVLLDERDARIGRIPAAMLLTDLGISGARRHAVIRFWRGGIPPPRALYIDGMGIPAMASMIFIDSKMGPDSTQVLDAAHRALGNPGRFLGLLRAVQFDTHLSRAIVVHETAPPYVIQPSGGKVPASRSVHRAGSSLLSAQDRAARLAGRGRHAAAVRLLTRAARLFEALTQLDRAASSALQLAWILRDRGRSQAALEQFERARRLGRSESAALNAAIGIGIVWTDQCRFSEAGAALRTALSAAELIEDAWAATRARVALARCLFWQKRQDDAAMVLSNLAVRASGADPDVHVHGSALLARILIERRDYPAALAAATAALQLARAGAPRSVPTAARALAIVHFALGNCDAAQVQIRDGLAAAAEAHVPLAALRLRATLLTILAQQPHNDATRLCGQVRWALAHRVLPPLLRGQLESAVAVASARTGGSEPKQMLHAALDELQRFIELAHGASDDAAAAEALCRDVCETVRAATVQILSCSERRLLARAGRPWSGDLQFIERVIAGGAAVTPADGAEPPRAAEPIRYSNEIVAVLACRWSAGAQFDRARAAPCIRAAALASVPSVRGMLDRVRPASEPCWRDLLGGSRATEALRAGISRAARAPFPVLIEGESGSGKELVARAIHRLSARRDRRLCIVNCAAISDELLEAELFGHARGAFTGAIGERAGLFEEADGGTLFLDEVGELSARAQAKLLRVLQDGEVRRVGENIVRRVDARVIAATNRCLEQEVVAGRFRTDLRFRLDVVRITVPPLRERPTDIPELAAHFWDEAARRVGSRATLSPDTLSALSRYEWPGNVRQLQNVIASLAVDAPRRGRIPPSLLPGQIARGSIAAATTFESARAEFERRFVAAALARAGGQRARAARALGITRQGLAKMLRRLKLDAD